MKLVLILILILNLPCLWNVFLLLKTKKRKKMFCKVHQCIHPSFHVTREHYCRLCKEKGHGPFECKEETRMHKLDPFQHDELPVTHHCQYPLCPKRSLHISEAHFCHTCGHLVPCIHMTFGLPLGVRTDNKNQEETKKLECPTCRTINAIPSSQPKIYLENPATCTICQDNQVEVFLPQCGHAILCLTCMNKLNQIFITRN